MQHTEKISLMLSFLQIEQLCSKTRLEFIQHEDLRERIDKALDLVDHVEKRVCGPKEKDKPKAQKPPKVDKGEMEATNTPTGTQVLEVIETDKMEQQL